MLEILAECSRDCRPNPDEKPPSWLETVRQLLHLTIVDKELRGGLPVQARLPHVVDDTDDLLWRQIHSTVQVDQLSHRIFAPKEPPCERGIDDDR